MYYFCQMGGLASRSKMFALGLWVLSLEALWWHIVELDGVGRLEGEVGLP